MIGLSLEILKQILSLAMTEWTVNLNYFILPSKECNVSLGN